MPVENPRKTKPEYLAKKKVYYKKNRTKILKAKQEYRKPRRDLASATTRAWYAENKDRAKQTAFKIRLRNAYGITVEQFHEIRAEQQGRCAVCRREAQLCVDHDHATGKIRGLLCRKCNAALGMFMDDHATLRRAIHYLKVQ
jgi:hypothetical protein